MTIVKAVSGRLAWDWRQNTLSIPTKTPLSGRQCLYIVLYRQKKSLMLVQKTLGRSLIIIKKRLMLNGKFLGYKAFFVL